MSLRSALGTLQLPVATAGALVAVASFHSIGQIAPTPEQGGLPGGLAMLFLYAFGVVGIAVCALGFAIPPGDGFGVTFTRKQRYLFGLSAAGAVGSAVLPVLSLPLILGVGHGGNVGWLIAAVWLGPLAVSLLSLAAALCWRGATALLNYRSGDSGGASPDGTG